eukprot:2832047-Pyramimonas_sp.AAC.1
MRQRSAGAFASWPKGSMNGEPRSEPRSRSPPREGRPSAHTRCCSAHFSARALFVWLMALVRTVGAMPSLGTVAGSLAANPLFQEPGGSGAADVAARARCLGRSGGGRAKGRGKGRGGRAADAR